MLYSLEAWRHLTEVVFDVAVLTNAKDFRAKADFVTKHRLLLSNVQFSAQRLDHAPDRICSVDHEYLLYERYLAGTGRGQVGETPTRIDTGTVHLIDMSRHYRTITSEVATRGVVVPHKLVGYDPSKHSAYVSLPLASWSGRLLELAHAALCEAFKLDTPDAGHRASTFTWLVQTLMLGEPDERGPEHADQSRLSLLKHYISENLGDPTLCLETLCRQFGMSRTTLYRLFIEEGGVARYITQQRLDRCFSELLIAPNERGQVRKVAERWGFFEPGNFHRCFRQRFGIRPSDCIYTPVLPSRSSETSKVYPEHRWFKR